MSFRNSMSMLSPARLMMPHGRVRYGVSVIVSPTNQTRAKSLPRVFLLLWDIFDVIRVPF